MCKFLLVLALLPLALCKTFAQSPDTEPPRFTVYEQVAGSVSSLGALTKIDTNVGYFVTRRVWVSAGLPVYFALPSASVTAGTGAQAGRGIGNAYAQARFSAAREDLTFASTLTVTAPTGDEEKGFSTGKVTVDWSNYLERAFGRVTPFGEIGIANAVSDTRFFVRPYATSGFVTHLQGGVRFELARAVSVNAGAYASRPSGEQTVWSRVAAKGAGATVPSKGAGASQKGKGKPVFENEPVATGSADIARDHGFSTWLIVSPASCLDLYAGYVRSAQFSLNTISFGMGVSIGKLFRQGGM